MKNESALTQKMIRVIKRRGGFAVKIRGGPGQQRGLPDVIVCYHGIMIGIEVKMPGRERTLTKIQDSNLRRIKEAGGLAFVFTQVTEVEYLLDRLDEKVLAKA